MNVTINYLRIVNDSRDFYRQWLLANPGNRWCFFANNFNDCWVILLAFYDDTRWLLVTNSTTTTIHRCHNAKEEDAVRNVCYFTIIDCRLVWPTNCQTAQCAIAFNCLFSNGNSFLFWLDLLLQMLDLACFISYCHCME